MRMFLAIVVLCGCASSQPESSEKTFDVASVKPSDPDEVGGRVLFSPGGRFSVENCQLSFVLQRVRRERFSTCGCAEVGLRLEVSF